MATAPKSIFSKLGTWDILDRLATIQADAEIEKAAVPSRTVRELLAVLEERLPEVGLEIDETPSGDLTAGDIYVVVRASEGAFDARTAYQASA